MAVTVDRVIVELSAKIDAYNANVVKAQKEFSQRLTNIEKSAERMEAKTTKAFDGAGRALRRFVSAAAIGLVIKETQQLSDVFTEAGNRIAAASQISGLQARSLEDLRVAANQARSSFEPYVELYARILRSTKGVAESEEQVALATQIAAKAFKAGGAAATEQAAGVLQLSQALGSGVLQGDELRSIRENAPLIASAIAEEFKTTIAGLKNLGQEGKLTSDRIFAAIIKAQPEIEAAFATTNATIGDSFTRLRNSLIEYIGTSEGVQDAAHAVSRAVVAVADNFDDFADAAIITANILGGAVAGRALAALVASLASATAGATTASVAMAAFNRTVAFFGGPVGIALTAIGAAVAFMALRAREAKVEFGDFDRTLDKFNSTLKQLDADQARLSSLQKLLETNEGITQAIKEQGFASEEQLRLEVDTINKRIAKNKELAANYKALLEAQVASLSANIDAARRATSPVRNSEASLFGLGSLSEKEVDRINADYLSIIKSRQAAGKSLTAEERKFLEATVQIAEYQAKLEGAKETLEKLGQTIETVPGDKPPGFKPPLTAEQEAENERLLKKIKDAYNDLFETEAAGIERVRQERIKDVRESQLTEQQKVDAIKKIDATAAEQQRLLQKEIADDEKAIAEDALDARDRALGRVLSIARREFEARKLYIDKEIEALRKKGVDEVELERIKNEQLQQLQDQQDEFQRKARASLPTGRGGDIQGLPTRDSVGQEIQDIIDAEAEKLQALQDAFDARIIQEEEFQARRVAVINEAEQQIADIQAKAQQLQLNSAASTFGKLASATRSFLGEQSTAYKALFAVQQAFAIASAVVSIHRGVAEALGRYPPDFITAALIAGSGAAEIATIIAQSFKEGGMVSGPGTGTSDSVPARLSNGEFVVNAQATRQNRAMLEAINAGRRFAQGGFVGNSPNAALPAVGPTLAGQNTPAQQLPPPEVHLTNINTFDPAEALAAGLSAPAGSHTFITFVQRNQTAIKSALGLGARNGA